MQASHDSETDRDTFAKGGHLSTKDDIKTIHERLHDSSLINYSGKKISDR